MIESIRCWATRNLLDLYVDSRLTPTRRAAVKAHVSKCAACRAEVETLGGVRESLASVPPIDVPAGLQESILREFERERAEAPISLEALLPSPGQAAALAALALVLLAQKGPGPDSQAYEPPPAKEASR
jgi:anti-sigma factor RsiW